MSILMKQTEIGKRAVFITKADAELLVESGDAIHCTGYDIYEEVTEAERLQNYMTRNMMPVPVATKRRGRSIKSEIIDSYTDKLDTVGE